MTARDLDTVLTRYSAAERPLTPPQRLGNAGGKSGAWIWRYATGQGTRALRAWPPDGPGRDSLRRVHDWLALAHGLGFVAVPVPDGRGETLQEHAGRLWEVSPWMPGEAPRERPPAPGQVRAGFIVLGSFHQVLGLTGRSGPSPGLVARLAEVETLVGGGFLPMRWAVERAPRDSLADLAWRILDLAQSEAPRHAESIRRAAGQTCRLQACLRDARPDHFLFEGERVTGLIDFGAMDLDTVACDLARLLTEWLGRDRELRAEALDAYGSVRVLDTTEIALIDAFETSSALLAAAHWVRWHFVEGRVFEDGEAVVRGLTRGLERLAHLSAYGSP